MAYPATDMTHASGYAAASYLMFGALGAIIIALGFEYIGGYAPCPLCLMQRWAYYAAIPLAFLGLIFLSAGLRSIAGLLFLFAGLAFIANAGLGIYHAGVEWSWWPGPETCSSQAQPLATGGSGNLLAALQNNSVVSCSEATWRFLTLSFAGWNAVISAGLAGFGLFAANAVLDDPDTAG